MEIFDKYLTICRTRVDVELAAHWQYAMAREGGKPIKDEMAKARRAATSIKTLASTFLHLGEKRSAQLHEAAASLQQLADNLEPLARWAVGFQKFCIAERERERLQELDKQAHARWGDDDQAMEFEWQLIVEVCSEAGRQELANWLQSQGQYTGIDKGKFHQPFTLYSVKFDSIKDMRRAAIGVILERSGGVYKPTDISWDGKHCHVGVADYERYLAHRKQLAQATRVLLARVAG